MDAMEELLQLSDAMRQASALLADEDVDETPSASPSERPSTYLNVVTLGNTGAGKSAVLNSLIGHPALPTGEGGPTCAPICVDLNHDSSLSRKEIMLQVDSISQQVTAGALRHSLQERLSKSKSCEEINLKICTSTAPPLKLIDLPGVDKGSYDDLSEYVHDNDAILLIVIPATQAPEVASANAIRLAKEFDGKCTRTVGVISKIDQASDPKVLAAVHALLSNQGPQSTADIPWVALIGQSVNIASDQSGSAGADNSMETAWRAEFETLKSILTGAPQSKLGRVALVETLAHQILNHMKIQLPNRFSGGQSTARIEELLMEDQSVNRQRERFQKQSSLFPKLTMQPSVCDNRTSVAASCSNGVAGIRGKMKKQYLPHSHTSLMGLRFEEFMVVGADSRSINLSTGRVIDNDVMKHSYICPGVHVCYSGCLDTTERAALGVRRLFSEGELPIEDRDLPKDVSLASKHVAIFAMDYGNSEKNQFIVGGTKAGAGLGMSFISRSNTNTPYVIEEDITFACGGSGSRLFRDISPKKSYSLKKAKSFMKHGFEKARQFDWCTDGLLNSVTTFSDGRCEFESCEPKFSRPFHPYSRPFHPYSDWIKNYRLPLRGLGRRDRDPTTSSS